MDHEPTYFRARLEVIEDLIKSIDGDRDEKNNDRVVMRNGVFPKGYDEKGLIQQKLTKKNIPGQALTFEELTRFNNWFAMHPEKVAGKEIITSSREFPISIVGTKEDIIKTVKDIPSFAFNHRSFSEGDQASDGKESQDNFEFKLELKRKSAEAKLKLLSI